VDIQEPRPPTSPNMVVCLSSKDLNPPDRWLTSSQASSKANKDMLVLQLNPQANIPTNRWVMEVLLVLVATAAVRSNLKIPSSGVLQQLKIIKTASVVTKVDLFIHDRASNHLCECTSLSIMRGFFEGRGY